MEIKNNIVIGNTGNPLTFGSGSISHLIKNNIFADNGGGIPLSGTHYASETPSVFTQNIVDGNAYGIKAGGSNSYHHQDWNFYENTFKDISGDVFEIEYGQNFRIYSNNFISNDGLIIENKNANSVHAEGNWWGVSETSSVGSLVHDYADNFELGAVDVDPISSSIISSNPVAPPSGVSA